MIKAGGIEKSFGALKVLKGIDMQVDKGEIVAVLGASGAGKSTLLQILGTLSRPDAGELYIDGVNPFALSDRKASLFRNSRIGFVFQSHNLLPEFTAIENVMIPLVIGGRSLSSARAAAEPMLKMVGLSDRASHKPSQLSGGESQRVAIARSLACNPAIVLADEPTGNLDSATKEEIYSLLFSMREQLGQTMVIVTHDETFACRCDRTLHMRDGLFIQDSVL